MGSFLQLGSPLQVRLSSRRTKVGCLGPSVHFIPAKAKGFTKLRFEVCTEVQYASTEGSMNIQATSSRNRFRTWLPFRSHSHDLTSPTLNEREWTSRQSHGARRASSASGTTLDALRQPRFSSQMQS